MNDHLSWRYTTKKFDPSKTVTEEDFAGLMEVLRMAPSSFGLQPWKFVVVRDPELRRRLKDAASGQPQVTEASHFIVFCALTRMDPEYISRFITRMAEIRSVDRATLEAYERGMHMFLKSQASDEMAQWMKRQVYIPLGMLIAECARRKIDTSPMEGFDSAKVDELLGLDREGVTSVALCGIGYRAQDDRFAFMKKVRFELKELFIER